MRQRTRGRYSSMKIDEEQLLCVRLKNQFLIERAPCATVVSALCGLQAQFANNLKYALRIRGSDFDESSWDDGLVNGGRFLMYGNGLAIIFRGGHTEAEK